MIFFKKKIFFDLKRVFHLQLWLLVRFSIYILFSFFFYIFNQIDIAKIILILSIFNLLSSILTSFSKIISDFIKRNYKRIKRKIN